MEMIVIDILHHSVCRLSEALCSAAPRFSSLLGDNN